MYQKIDDLLKWMDAESVRAQRSLFILPLYAAMSMLFLSFDFCYLPNVALNLKQGYFVDMYFVCKRFQMTDWIL